MVDSRVLFVVVSIVCVVVVCQGGPIEDAIFNLSPRLQQFELSGKDSIESENFVVSPIGIALALGQLSAGLEENSPLKGVIYDLLERNANENIHPILQSVLSTLILQQSPSETFTLNITYAVFYDKSVKMQQQFFDTLNQYYGLSSHELPIKEDYLTSQAAINYWVTNKTNGLIRTFPLDPSTAIFLANAVYFNGEWVEPFWSALTRPGNFHISPTENITVDYMITQIDTLYAHDQAVLNCKLLRMPYVTQNRNASMYLILPNQHNLKDLISKLNARTFEQLLQTATVATVNVKMPKVQLSSEIKLRKYLRNAAKANNIGRGLFRQQFATDDKGKSVYLQQIMQKTVLGINEKGTTAASVAASTINYDGFSKNFAVLRPFVAIVRDDTTKTTLFWASIVNPNV